MSIWLILFLCLLIPTGVIIFLGIKNNGLIYVSTILVCAELLLLGLIIWQPISFRKERNRQLKEKQQIEYQVEHLTEDKDKIKLNEWILSYNDWVNDINAEKETWGIFAWHYNFDMTEFQIIDLV